MCPSKELDLAGKPFEKSKKQVIARDNQKPRTNQLRNTAKLFAEFKKRGITTARVIGNALNKKRYLRYIQDRHTLIICPLIDPDFDILCQLINPDLEKNPLNGHTLPKPITCENLNTTWLIQNKQAFATYNSNHMVTLSEFLESIKHNESTYKTYKKLNSEISKLSATYSTQQKNDRIAENRLKTLIDGLTGSGFPKGDYLTFYNFNQAYEERNSTKTPYEKAYYKRAFTSEQLVDWYEELNKTDVYNRNFKLQKQIAKSLVDTVIITSNPDWDPKKRQEKINHTINKLWDESTFNKAYSGTNNYTYHSVVWALQQFSQKLKSKLEKHYKTTKPFDMYGFIIKLLKQGKYADINKLPTPTTINLPQIETTSHFNAFVKKVISSLASEENIMLEFAAQFAITMPAIQLYADRKINTQVFTDNVKKLRTVAKKVEQQFPNETLKQYGDLPQKCVNDALLTCKQIFAVKIPS